MILWKTGAERLLASEMNAALAWMTGGYDAHAVPDDGALFRWGFWRLVCMQRGTDNAPDGARWEYIERIMVVTPSSSTSRAEWCERWIDGATAGGVPAGVVCCSSEGAVMRVSLHTPNGWSAADGTDGKGDHCRLTEWHTDAEVCKLLWGSAP